MRQLIKHTVLAATALFALSFGAHAENIPKHFRAYATVAVDGGRHCVVGAVSDEDGMGQHAYVYLEDAATHKLSWGRYLPLGTDWYQNRATHCLADKDTLYVLVQTDTQSQASLSQTFISVATLDVAQGKVRSTHDVDVPGAKGAVSAWVKKGADNFRLVGGKPTVTGTYFASEDADEPTTFTASPSSR